MAKPYTYSYQRVDYSIRKVCVYKGSLQEDIAITLRRDWKTTESVRLKKISKIINPVFDCQHHHAN